MSKLYNLREYHRPTDIDEAARLLRRKNIHTVVLAGGTQAVGEGTPDIEAVVDLDGLGLDFIKYEDSALTIGAMLRLQMVVEKLDEAADGLLADAARRTAGLHIRNMATAGGVLASGDTDSPFSVTLAALKARIRIYKQAGEMPLWSDLAGQIRDGGLKGKIITAIHLDLPTGQTGAWYEQVARTPADAPIVSAAAVACHSPDGDVDTTTAVGGLLQDLVVVNQKGDPAQPVPLLGAVVSQIIEIKAAETAYQANFRGSPEYRRSVAPVLARRALEIALSRLATSSKP
jgi:xanthine dehydrogenase FAD-binding subunit